MVLKITLNVALSFFYFNFLGCELIRRKHFAVWKKKEYCFNKRTRWKFIPLTVCFVEIVQKSPLFTCFAWMSETTSLRFSVYFLNGDNVKGFS